MDYAIARANMVDSQLRANKVSDPQVVEAFASVPRERFVQAGGEAVAYVDEDLPLGNGRHMMSPMVLARLVQAAAPTAGDMVLDVGCGSGYATAILARLAATVVGLESDPEVVARGSTLLSELSVDNAIVVQGELAAGYAKQAPYNVILIAGAVADVPTTLTDQLADGGRLVTVSVDAEGVGRATLLRRDAEVVSGRVLFDASARPMSEFQRPPAFVF